LGQKGCREAAGFFLQVHVPEIVIHKADQPNTFFDLLDTDSLSREDVAEINFFAMKKIDTCSWNLLRKSRPFRGRQENALSPFRVSSLRGVL
jgi:hypothetical protein